jgi:hypothetical protein
MTITHSCYFVSLAGLLNRSALQRELYGTVAYAGFGMYTLCGILGRGLYPYEVYKMTSQRARIVGEWLVAARRLIGFEMILQTPGSVHTGTGGLGATIRYRIPVQVRLTVLFITHSTKERVSD